MPRAPEVQQQQQRHQQSASQWVPEASPKNILLGIGTACLFGMVYFWKRKQTTPFKACWAIMWPTLGGGIMLAVQPDEEQLAKLVPPDELQKRREANEAIRRMAAGSSRPQG